MYHMTARQGVKQGLRGLLNDGPVAGMADAPGSRPGVAEATWGFKSLRAHQIMATTYFVLKKLTAQTWVGALHLFRDCPAIRARDVETVTLGADIPTWHWLCLRCDRRRA